MVGLVTSTRGGAFASSRGRGLRYLWVVAGVATVLAACGETQPPDVDGSAPVAPTNVTVVSGPGSITVAWEHEGVNVTGFVVYREAVTSSTAARLRPSALTELVQVGSAERSYRDDQVVVGTSYRYAVAARGTGMQQSSSTAQTVAPVEPGPIDGTIADYVVGPGVVATLASLSGQIVGYDGGAVDATLAGLAGSSSPCPIGDDECEPSFTPGKPWVPTSIDAEGRFTVPLPASPEIGEGSRLNVCGAEDAGIDIGALYVHEAPFGEPGSLPTASFARVRFEDPKTPFGFLADAAVLISYWFSPTAYDLTCVESFEEEGVDAYTADVDLKVRSGWNVLTWVQRSEGDDMVLYLRTGEPGLAVPWIAPEPLF